MFMGNNVKNQSRMICFHSSNFLFQSYLLFHLFVVSLRI